MVLQNLWKRCPTTMVFVIIAAGLYAARGAYEIAHPDHAGESLRSFGGAVQLVKTERGEAIEEFSGPFDVWDGEVWRLLVNGFHHGDLLHLICNCSFILYLGWLLEPWMGRLRFAFFFIFATFATIIAQYLPASGADAVGLSGSACAMLGALIPARRTDVGIAMHMNDRFVGACILSLFFMAIMTRLGWLPIANIAHFAGLAYGFVVGYILVERPLGLLRPALVAVHLVIAPVVWLVENPVWVGCYHWHRAEQQRETPLRQAGLERALELDDSLVRAWADLAVVYWMQDDRQRAWKTALIGIDRNRSSNKTLRELIHDMWWKLGEPDDQRQAVADLLEVFPGDSEFWFDKLRLDVPPPPRLRVPTPEELVELPVYSPSLAPPLPGRTGEILQQRMRFPWAGSASDSPVDPHHPHSALEGLTI